MKCIHYYLLIFIDIYLFKFFLRIDVFETFVCLLITRKSDHPLQCTN